jgi:hypothetical protein
LAWTTNQLVGISTLELGRRSAALHPPAQFAHLAPFYTVLAEFIIHVHEKSADYTAFKDTLQDAGDFSPSFIGNLDRLIRTMHPKYKKAAEPTSADKAAVADQKAHKFPGLAIPDRPGWVCSRFRFRVLYLHPSYFQHVTSCYSYADVAVFFIVDGR